MKASANAGAISVAGDGNGVMPPASTVGVTGFNPEQAVSVPAIKALQNNLFLSMRGIIGINMHGVKILFQMLNTGVLLRCED